MREREKVMRHLKRARRVCRKSLLGTRILPLGVSARLNDQSGNRGH